MENSRDLMFGALALEMAFVDSGRLAECFAKWQGGREGPFAEWLVRQGVISTDEAAEIERCLVRKLAMNGGDAERWLASAMTIEAQAAVLDADCDSLRKTLSFAPGASAFSPLGPAGPPTDRRTKYTRTRVHGQGGLGRVWLARDNHLRRSVALKEILAGRQSRPQELARFIQEAQITSQLEHPNIVPVYELTTDESEGAAFYTMRFVHGKTLRVAIDDYHQRRRRGEAGPLELRNLLQAFVGICHALAFAHSRGVIHRDLKPANIMLGAFGEVVVLDWGLAKFVDAPELPETPTDHASIDPYEAQLDATQEGAILGTLAFMAPEQASGAVAEVGRQTDIYGLGAILFAILTGNPPHQGGSTHELRSRILNEPTPQSRRVDATVPLPLDAVCAKAMAKSGKDRYATARDLSEDVQRWLADEPVSVHQDDVATRVVRWIRRNRSWAAAMGVTLLCVTGAATAAAIVTDLARRSEAKARMAERQAKEAEQLAKNQAARRLSDARAVLDSALTQMSRELQDYPGVQQLRRTLLERAAADYARFAGEQSQDRALQLESVRAWLRLAEVYELLDLQENALNACQQAQSVLRSQTPANESPESVLLTCVAARKAGTIRRKAREWMAAGELLQQAAAAIATLPRPGVETEVLLEMARIDLERARLSADQEDLAAAWKRLQATALLLESDDSAANSPLVRRQLAVVLGESAEVLTGLGRSVEALAVAERAANLHERLAADSPNQPDSVEGAAESALRWANASRAIGRAVDELRAYRTAIREYQGLVQARPEITRYRANLAIAQNDLAQLWQSLGENKEARRAADDAIAGFTYLIQNHPPDVAYYEGLAVAEITLGRAWVALGDNEQASTQFQSALRVYRELLIPNHPTDATFRRGLGLALANFGRLKQVEKRWKEALEQYERALAELDSIGDPANRNADPVTRDAWAWTKSQLAECLWRAEEREVANTAWREVIATRESLPKSAGNLANLARLLVFCDNPELRNPQRAIELAAEAAAQTPENDRYRFLIALAKYRSGEFAEAERITREVMATRPIPNANDEVLLAMALQRQMKKEDAQRVLRESLATRYAEENRGSFDFQRLVAEANELITP